MKIASRSTKKENILVVFGEVKQTMNTPTTITRLRNTKNAPKPAEVGYLDQQEESLIKYSIDYDN